MRPADFRTLRESLLLSEKDVSMLTLVKETQIKAWEAGSEDVPEGTSGLLADIDKEIDKRLKKARIAARDKADVVLKRFANPATFRRNGPDMKPIPQFLAYRCHCALIMRLRLVLLADGKEVTVRYDTTGRSSVS